jgi:hypothetical protein
MKRDYLLIIGGVIPLLFIIYIFKFFGEDERTKQMESAILLSQDIIPTIKLDEFVLVNGKISETQPILEQDLVFLQVEEKIRQRDRSVWTNLSTNGKDLHIHISEDFSVHLKLDTEDYSLCGGMVKLLPIEGKDPKKHRILGLSRGTEVTGYGKVTNLNPLEVNVGRSLCAETLMEYKNALGKKTWAYALAVLFLSIPSLFLIYLGLFKGRQD